MMTNQQILTGATPFRRVLRIADVAIKTGLSRATIWKYAKDKPDFPKPFKLDIGITVWEDSELDAWIDAQKAAARQPA